MGYFSAPTDRCLRMPKIRRQTGNRIWNLSGATILCISKRTENFSQQLHNHCILCKKDFPLFDCRYNGITENARPGIDGCTSEIEHIFSELYNVPVKIKKDYFKIKVLELLLYLDALELSGHTEERPYFYKSQVEKIKAIQSLLTQDLTKNYTLEELSAKFDIALTPMKNCFKSVYGSPIFTYMRNYRMNYAAALLKSDKSLKVADVAGLVGYDSPSKFTAAFHQTMGKTPLEYRKSII